MRVIREIPLTHSIPDVCRRMSTELTKTVYDNPHGERILSLLSAVLFNIQGNYASLRAKPVHISGHLPTGNRSHLCICPRSIWRTLQMWAASNRDYRSTGAATVHD